MPCGDPSVSSGEDTVNWYRPMPCATLTQYSTRMYAYCPFFVYCLFVDNLL